MQEVAPGAVKVDRSTKWGNPFKVGEGSIRSSAMAVELFRATILGGRSLPLGFRPAEIAQLRGRDLACWCKPGAPCHGDVLLEIANRPLTAAE